MHVYMDCGWKSLLFVSFCFVVVFFFKQKSEEEETAGIYMYMYLSNHYPFYYADKALSNKLEL